MNLLLAPNSFLFVRFCGEMCSASSWTSLTHSIMCSRPACVIVGRHIASGTAPQLLHEPYNIPRRIPEMAIKRNFTLLSFFHHTYIYLLLILSQLPRFKALFELTFIAYLHKTHARSSLHIKLQLKDMTFWSHYSCFCFFISVFGGKMHWPKGFCCFLPPSSSI